MLEEKRPRVEFSGLVRHGLGEFGVGGDRGVSATVAGVLAAVVGPPRVPRDAVRTRHGAKVRATGEAITASHGEGTVPPMENELMSNKDAPTT